MFVGERKEQSLLLSSNEPINVHSSKAETTAPQDASRFVERNALTSSSNNTTMQALSSPWSLSACPCPRPVRVRARRARAVSSSGDHDPETPGYKAPPPSPRLDFSRRAALAGSTYLNRIKGGY